MREGHCQLRNWRVEVPQTVLIIHKFSANCMRLVVKKWIPQYGVAVFKNKEICDFVESCFDTKKALLTTKRNSLMLFLE